MITTANILMNRAKFSNLTTQQQENLQTLQNRVNALLATYKGSIQITSGYRPPQINKAAGGAAKSWHQECAAIDLADADGKLFKFVLDNLELCADIGLWIEDKRWTPTWVHLQIYPPKSGKRIFAPSAKPAAAPNAWSGKYNSKLNSKV